MKEKKLGKNPTRPLETESCNLENFMTPPTMEFILHNSVRLTICVIQDSCNDTGPKEICDPICISCV